MSSSALRGLNNTNTPLLAGIVFRGKSEFVGSLLTVLVNCYADTAIRVDCYENAVPSDTTQEVFLGSTVIVANTLTQIPLNLSFPNFRLDVANTSASNQLQLNINTIYTNLLPLDTGVVIDVSGNVVVSGTVSLTNPTVVRVADYYGSPITTTSGNANININAISTATALNVGIIATANTIKIDQSSVATNGVRTIAPDTFSARVKTASSTGVLVTAGGHLLNFIATNTSALVDAYVKLYDSVSAPAPGTDEPFMIAHVSRDATILTPVLQVNTANLKITNNLWVRAVVGSADTNTDSTGVSLDITFFGTAT